MAKPGAGADKSARPEWRQKFLETLAKSSNVTSAARAAKVSVSKAYAERRTDPDFYAAWQTALCEGYDSLELELLSRLRMGELEPPKDQTGKNGRAKRKFDNAMAFRLLSAHRESVGRERARQQSASEKDIIASINAKLDMMRDRIDQEESHGDGGGDA